MILFPYGKVVLATEKEKKQVVQILSDNLRKRSIIQMLFKRCDNSCCGYLNGSVRRSSFKITTIRCGTNTFKPIFKGVLETKEGKTIIVIKARLNIIMLGFIFVWLEFYGRLMYSDIKNFDNWGGMGFVLLVLVTVSMYCIINYYFWKEFRTFKSYLCELLEAKEVE